MGFISDALSEDASFCFDEDVMPGAETVEVTPKGGTAREVVANVLREPFEQVGEYGKRPKAIIALRVHATLGLLMSEVKTGATVTYNLRQGDDSTETTAPASLSTAYPSDEAVIWLEV